MGPTPSAFCVAACSEPGLDVPPSRRNRGGEWYLRRPKGDELLVFGRPSRLNFTGMRRLRLQSAAVVAGQSLEARQQSQRAADDRDTLLARPNQWDAVGSTPNSDVSSRLGKLGVGDAASVLATVENRSAEEEDVSPLLVPKQVDAAPRMDVVDSIAEKGAALLAQRSEEDGFAPGAGVGKLFTDDQGNPVHNAQPSPRNRLSTDPLWKAGGARPTTVARTGEFIVYVVRPAGKSVVGLQVVPVMNTHLRIARITEGLVGDWNRDNPALEVKASTLIMEVNGVRGDATPMLAQIRNARELLMHMKRPKHSVEQ